MKIETREVTTTITLYRSEVLPEVYSTNSDDKPIIAWADAYPGVWKLVNEKKSAFGPKSAEYPAYWRGTEPRHQLGRATQLYRTLCTPAYGYFHKWRLELALSVVGKKGFESGYFRQWDGSYFRHSIYMDFNEATLKAAIGKFIVWAEWVDCYAHKTLKVFIGDEVVWEANKGGKK